MKTKVNQRLQIKKFDKNSTKKFIPEINSALVVDKRKGDFLIKIIREYHNREKKYHNKVISNQLVQISTENSCPQTLLLSQFLKNNVISNLQQKGRFQMAVLEEMNLKSLKNNQETNVSKINKSQKRKINPIFLIKIMIVSFFKLINFFIGEGSLV